MNMLLAKPTKYGAGIAIYGDYWDLQSLHQTIHELSAGSPLEGDMENFLLGLAYDIRHAYQRDREEESFGYDEYDRVTYRGEKVLWPIFLLQTALLRWSAAYQSTNKEQQANLYRLEYCAESALNQYDPSIAKKCIEWLNTFSGVSNNYLTMYVSEVSYKYIFTNAAGKPRFKRLPVALHSLHSLTKEYKEFQLYIESVAKEKGCKPHELLDLSEWPDFKW
jgi:hypothetical protein